MPRFALTSADDDCDDFHDDTAAPTSDLNYSDDSDDDDVDEFEDDDDDDEDVHRQQFAALNSSKTARYALDEDDDDDDDNAIIQYRRRWGYPHRTAKDLLLVGTTTVLAAPPGNGGWTLPTYPPLRTYLDVDTAPTEALWRLCLTTRSTAANDIDDKDDDDKDDDLTRFLLARRRSRAGNPFALLQQQQQQRILQTQNYAQQQQKTEPVSPTGSTKLSGLREALDRENDQATHALQQWLHQQQQLAAQIQRAEQEQQEQEEKEQQEQIQKEKEEEEENRRRHAAAQEKKAAQQIQLAQQQEAETAAAQQRAAAATAIPDYVQKAQQLTAQLIPLQASVEPFDTAKAAAPRRLRMKKIVNGRINTLSESVDKIRQVATEVTQAIEAARQEDESIKQQQAAQYPPELARGKRYLVNLLASKVIVRAQAEGFNGQRGDGFPLAHMLAHVAAETKDLIPVLTAHIYTVCPTAIPTLPHIAPDASEEELMQSLGMLRGKDGQFESFPRFLSRTEGVISLVANIMASQPSSHSLFGGHVGAVKWISRFLDLLPPAPQTPLPLLTAPVLDAFLTAAGHMLANTHAEEFQPLFDRITDDIVHRLDESAIGMPSATRLRKTIREGLSGFRQQLPSRALPELYYGASASVAHENSSNKSSSPFRTMAPTNMPGPAMDNSGTLTSPWNNNNSNSNNFGASNNNNNNISKNTDQPATDSQGKRLCIFFLQGKCNKGSRCNFSHEVPAATGSTSFGNAASSQSPFGGNGSMNASNNSPFGGPPASSSPFGNSAPQLTSNPLFGSSGAPATTFGGLGGGVTGSTSANPFGSSTPFGSSNSGAAVPTPFGANTNPFGGGSTGPSPFGNPQQSTTNNAPLASSSPFGSAAPGPSPFGGPFGSQAPSPANVFGSPMQPQQSTAPSPFGMAPAPTPFSNNPSPFGVAAPSPSPFGMPSANPSPFSNTSVAAASPFGSANAGFQQQQPTAFSSAPNNNNQSGRGGKPCTFFAKGNCRYGANCKYSHNAVPSPFNNNNPFGAPRR